jgi:uncharacterized protein with HEPN domain
MQLEIQKYLFDIKTSVDSINDYIGDNKDFVAYKTNKLLKRAIEREIEIIGEAAGRIIKIDSGFPIEDARKIVDLRNWGKNEIYIDQSLEGGVRREGSP